VGLGDDSDALAAMKRTVRGALPKRTLLEVMLDKVGSSQEIGALKSRADDELLWVLRDAGVIGWEEGAFCTIAGWYFPYVAAAVSSLRAVVTDVGLGRKRGRAGDPTSSGSDTEGRPSRLAADAAVAAFGSDALLATGAMATGDVLDFPSGVLDMKNEITPFGARV